MEKRIMFFGPSGTGKTTLSKYISENYGMPFIDGSMKSLMSKFEGMNHLQIMNRDPKQIYLDDLQLLNLRSKLFRDNTQFVTDRSYLDIMAYHIIKSSKENSKCDSDTLLYNIVYLLFRDCTHLIFLPFTDKMIETWSIEDNDNRILNNYFQWQVSLVMRGLLRLLQYKSSILGDHGTIKLSSGMINNLPYHSGIDNNKSIKVLILDTEDYATRINRINRFLNL